MERISIAGVLLSWWPLALRWGGQEDQDRKWTGIDSFLNPQFPHVTALPSWKLENPVVEVNDIDFKCRLDSQLLRAIGHPASAHERQDLGS
ncbi:hypothetical protein N7539_001755 [Penicillium diatomitis]|uniref:Uncharacterized protein n=1 Tax=Penicillium diatomitis TaxID=2819901 RepID=A0A9W9XIJ5_9EURO|nr:uncharacterized protein N7539_001755 [Penicillium diatomitis]KAJ5493009.1 hypothetical protein N7539_001755 [Penicillium diatomitis]